MHPPHPTRQGPMKASTPKTKQKKGEKMLHRINSDFKNRNFGAAILKMWLSDKLLRPSRPRYFFGFEKKI